MRFTAKSEKEIKEERLLPEGEYPFQISGGEDKISKSGNEMIQLMVRVFKPDGNFQLVTDYLLESMSYKLRHAAEACGLLSKYESGELLGTDFIGKTGHLKLKIQVDKTGQYADKNFVADYLIKPVAEAGATPAPAEKPKDTLADEIPW